MDARRLTPANLLAETHGEIGKNGWFCQYGLFTRRNRPIFAAYCGHRMTNEHYEELAADGKRIFAWSSDGGMSFGEDSDRQYQKVWRRVMRRAIRANIRVFP